MKRNINFNAEISIIMDRCSFCNKNPGRKNEGWRTFADGTVLCNLCNVSVGDEWAKKNRCGKCKKDVKDNEENVHKFKDGSRLCEKCNRHYGKDWVQIQHAKSLTDNDFVDGVNLKWMRVFALIGGFIGGLVGSIQYGGFLYAGIFGGIGALLFGSVGYCFGWVLKKISDIHQ